MSMTSTLPPVPVGTSGVGVAVRVGLVSTFPPTICGLATFAASLGEALGELGASVQVIEVVDREPSVPNPTVAGRLLNGSPASRASIAAQLSSYDVAIIQHEYGIYGGPDGDEVLDLLAASTAPAISILHTVPLHPTRHQCEVLAAVCARSNAVVVMTNIARQRLLAGYPVDSAKVSVIVHGARTPTTTTTTTTTTTGNARPGTWPASTPQLLTWGLLGPGKGIEHVIDALSHLRDLDPRPRYTVAGITHPNVAMRQGEDYRNSLIRRSRLVSVYPSVVFDSAYRSTSQLTAFVASSQIVVLPYDSRDQVTSGVLVDAIAAGRPVVATAFPHAVEVLSSGAGIVVPHGDPIALAEALLTDPAALASVTAEAVRLAPQYRWSEVAAQYLTMCRRLSHDRVAS
jgi:polysaccharide biosynthesis protein PslF